MRAVVSTVVAGCAFGLALAACGSAVHGYNNPRYPYGAPNVPISTSKCMRANGIPSFPDPREGPNGGGVGFPGGFGISEDGGIFIMGQTFSGPAVLHAEKVCKEYMPPSGPPPAIPEAQKVKALAEAACMRKHGLPNFPDPIFHGRLAQVSLAPGLSPESPAVKRAAAACGLGGNVAVGP